MLGERRAPGDEAHSADDEYDACQFHEYSFLMFNYSESMLPLQSECHPFDIGYLA